MHKFLVKTPYSLVDSRGLGLSPLGSPVYSSVVRCPVQGVWVFGLVDWMFGKNQAHTQRERERDKHAHDHGERVVSSGEVQKEREERGLGEKKKAKWGLISGNTSQLTNAPTHTNRAQFFVFF